ncbi:MAG TPA: HlyD family secretion protein [Balneolales bacterium]|nr:HlyD family secretion protein [Balneolales bacterium]
MSKNSQGNESQNGGKKKLSTGKIILYSVLAIILIVGGLFGYKEFRYYTTHVETEDAQTDGYITPVTARVSGYITEIKVNDNEHVKKGQLLAQIDTTDYALKVRMAKSALSSAKASLDVAKAAQEQAKVALDKAKLDFKRAAHLYKGGATTRKNYDDAQAALNAAKAKYNQTVQKVEQVKTNIKSQQDNLSFAKLQLSYTHITAPDNGVISKKKIQVGQLIQTGQPLMAVTNTHDVWVTANFKETELQHIKVGQLVKIHIDAYPGHDFTGRVQSFAGATGAKYALLPPENATGNFVKVVQRVPVKIVFNKNNHFSKPLQLGLNVTASIDYDQPSPSSNSTATNLSH